MDAQNTDDLAICPWSLVVDTNEGAPFPFVGMRQLKSHGGRQLIIRTIRKPMWSMGRKEWGTGLADYSIDGFEEQVQIERKSIEDLFGTLGSRRDDFEREIDRLNRQCAVACVMVEGTVGHIAGFKGHGPEPQSVIGTMIAWQQRYRNVHWHLPPSRSIAEVLTFRILDRFWREHARIASAVASQKVAMDGEKTKPGQVV